MKQKSNKLSQAVKKFTSLQVIKENKTRKIYKKACKTYDLLYFGTVSQHEDDHRLLRGITASVNHQDDHYCVGTYKTYDIAMVLRRDNLNYHDGRIKNHRWAIVTADIHTRAVVPNFFISHNSKRELMMAKQNGMHKINPQLLSNHSIEFTQNFELYGATNHQEAILALLIPEITQSISIHCKQFSIEVFENTVFILLETEHPTPANLQRMINITIWLAQIVDMRYAQAYTD